MGVERLVSPAFGGPFEKDRQVVILAKTVKQLDLVRGGVVEEPEDSHAPIIALTRV